MNDDIRDLEPKGLCVTYPYEAIITSFESYDAVIAQIKDYYIPTENSDLVEITKVGCCCSECAKYQGRIYSLTGMDLRFPLFPKWLSETKCAHCGLQMRPFIYGFSIARYVEGDVFETSNRPFIDDRSQEEMDAYYRIIHEYEEEQEDRRIYVLLQKELDEEAPKSYNAYRRMKSQQSKGYLNLVKIAKEHGIKLSLNETATEKKYSEPSNHIFVNPEPSPLTLDEKNSITNLLQYVKESYPEEKQALGLAYESGGIMERAAYVYTNIIILKYEGFSNPFDIIAVAIAYKRKGAKYRKKALEYYEQLLKMYNENNKSISEVYSSLELHYTLADLYEKEHQYEKAIFELNICADINKCEEPSDFTRVGDIFIKISTEKAKAYYDELLQSEAYKKHKTAIDYAYRDLEEKIERGYVYKPRKTKTDPELSEEERFYIEAAKQFI